MDAPQGPHGRALTVGLDLDGVVWHAGVPLPGAAEAVARLRAAGHRVAFCTNDGCATVATHVARLGAAGIDATVAEVVSSAMAVATLVEPGERVLLLAGPGVAEALHERGATVVEPGSAIGDVEAVDAVVVGFHPGFDEVRAAAAAAAIRGGARFLASNDDPTYPTPDGLVPGSGAIVDAVAARAGCRPTVAGKPHPPTVAAVRHRFGALDWVVGDRPDTDGGLAVAGGARFALVLSGVTATADGAEPTPDVVAPDLAGAVDLLLGMERRGAA